MECRHYFYIENRRIEQFKGYGSKRWGSEDVGVFNLEGLLSEK